MWWRCTIGQVSSGSYAKTRGAVREAFVTKGRRLGDVLVTPGRQDGWLLEQVDAAVSSLR